MQFSAMRFGRAQFGRSGLRRSRVCAPAGGAGRSGVWRTRSAPA